MIYSSHRSSGFWSALPTKKGVKKLADPPFEFRYGKTYLERSWEVPSRKTCTLKHGKGHPDGAPDRGIFPLPVTINDRRELQTLFGSMVGHQRTEQRRPNSKPVNNDHQYPWWRFHFISLCLQSMRQASVRCGDHAAAIFSSCVRVGFLRP